MKRTINIEEERDQLNYWVSRSIELFETTPYIDRISEVYNYGIAESEELDRTLRRRIIQAHANRNDEELIECLTQLDKFPYDEPFWYILSEADGYIDSFIEGNTNQVDRIAESLYRLTIDELLAFVESPPKLNQQSGPMFSYWINRNFEVVNIDRFQQSTEGILLLGGSEQQGHNFVEQELGQEVDKRPDLIAKVNNQYVIGEAKWVGSPGGKQNNSISEALDFCSRSRGNIQRVSIIDGFVWMTRTSNGAINNNKGCVLVQESPFNVFTALLLEEYFQSLL